MYGILHLCSKRFQNEIKIMKYLNILDLLYFVISMCCFGLVSGAGGNKKGARNQAKTTHNNEKIQVKDIEVFYNFYFVLKTFRVQM